MRKINNATISDSIESILDASKYNYLNQWLLRYCFLYNLSKLSSFTQFHECEFAESSSFTL